MKGPWGSEVEAILPFLYVTESVFSSGGFKRCLLSQWQALMPLLPLMLLALSRLLLELITSFVSKNRFLNQDLVTKAAAAGKEVLLNRGRAISTFYHTDLTSMSTQWT